MNWSGGYKNRFRSRQETLSHKNVFQQQSRIPLIDDVDEPAGTDLNDQSLAQLSNSKLPEAEAHDKMYLMNDNKNRFTTPQGGVSSGSEDSSVASSTNYSPHSFQVSPIENEKELGILNNSSDDEGDTPPFLPNQDQHQLHEYSIFSTPNINCQPSKEFFSDAEVGLLFSSPPLESNPTTTLPSRDIVQSPITYSTKRNSSELKQFLPYPTSNRLDCFPLTQRKKVRFTASDGSQNSKNEDGQTLQVKPSRLESEIAENSENAPPSTDTIRQSGNTSEVPRGKDHTDNLSISLKSPNRPNPPFPFRKKTKSPFKKANLRKFHNPCHCRTVVRTIKVRDAETQTSD